jgi:hypothetical protein
MKTYYIHEYREYSVTATAAGRCVIKEASHPTSVAVGVEFAWYVVGHVADAVVRNPGIAYMYKDGPAASVKLVRKDGAEIDVPKGSAVILYRKGDVAVCTNIDSRDAFKGAKFPVAGTYTIWLMSGYLSDAEAAMGVATFAGMYELATFNVAEFEGAPAFVVAWQDALRLAGAAVPLIVAGSIILTNELSKWK